MLIRFTIALAILSMVSLGGTEDSRHEGTLVEPESPKVQLIEFTEPLIIKPRR